MPNPRIRLNQGCTPAGPAHTGAMALEHSLPGQAADVSPLGHRLATQRTTALFKSADLEVIRLVLRAGESLPPHSVNGEVTLQCIEGRLDVQCNAQSHVLLPGQLLYLLGKTPRSVKALDDASALLTIVVRK